MPIPGWPDATVELVGDHALHDLPDVLADQPNGVIDDARLAAVVAAALRLRLLILDETLQTLPDQLHDGVDDAPLLEVAVTASATAIVAVVTTVSVAATATAIVTIVVPAVIVVIVTISAIMAVVTTAAVVPIVTMRAIVPIVVASIVVPVAIAAAVLPSAFVTGARPNEPFERFQSFEDLTSIVVSHGLPPSGRLPWPARAMQALSPMGRHPRNAIAIASARRTVLRERAERGPPH